MTEVLPEEMPTTPLPANEANRLSALHRYNILDTPPEATFDELTQLAAQICQAPVALITFVDADRQWFQSSIGADVTQAPLEAGFCPFVVQSKDTLIIPDTLAAPQFATNPVVVSQPNVRFYAGTPLITRDGYSLGTLCVLDYVPRQLTPEQVNALQVLSRQVMAQLELRLKAHQIAQIDAALLKVTQGIAAATGEAFFHALVQHFTQVLGVNYTYIGLVVDREEEEIQTLAACAHGQIVNNFSYLLRDTPCQKVIQQRLICCYERGVQAQFPDAPLLAPLGIESYMAIPFYDSTGTPLGLLGIMHGKPLENVQLAESLLTIFALRIATELERQQTEVARQQAQDDLENLVNQRTTELSRVNELLCLESAERQQAKAALQQEQELLKALLDNVQAGIVACNVEGILTLFNRAARNFHGLPEQPLPPEEWADQYDLYRPDGKTRMPKEEIPLFRALQGQPVENVEMMIVPKQGTTRTLLASGQAIADAQGKQQGAVVVMHDITERKQAEVERAQLIREQTARLEAEAANRIKDEFLAVLSHELRTPLNPILGWSKLLRGGKLDATKTAQALETIERNAKLQVQLIEDLLDISRILRGKLSLNIAPVDLALTIQSALETVRLAAEAKTIQIQAVFAPAIRPVLGDAARLQQVIWNLLSNAVKFTPEGGRVEIQLDSVGLHAQIQVKDTGKGIPLDFLPYVFDCFRQADSTTTRKFGGLGLGLAIVRQLVEQHGGTVQAESSGEGQGSTFTVRLPLMKPEGRKMKNKDRSSSTPSSLHPLANVQILLVDDDVDTRDLITFTLEQSGAIVTSVASAVKALQAFAQSKPHVLVSDIGMPDMDGYMLMQQIRAMPHGRRILAVALTAYAGELNQQQALAAGFQRHLAKPVEPDELVQAIVTLAEESLDG